MKSIKLKTILLVMVVIMSLFVAACSSKSSDANPVDKSGAGEKEVVEKKEFSNEEVTLKVATPWGKEYFMDRIGNHMEESLPHITLEHIDWDGTVTKLEEHYAADVIPDVLLAYTGQAPLEELEMVFPLDEMIKEYGVDLSDVNSALLDELRSRHKENGLIGVPAETGGVLALHYNKEVFDIFGVPYPTEAMTWTETLDLAKQMTGERNGTFYRGFETEAPTAPLGQLSVNMTDPETGDVLITEDPAFTKYMDFMEDLFSIPGLYNEDPETRNTQFAQGTAAMHISWHGYLTWFGGEDAQTFQKNMDILPIPHWEDLPNVIPSRGSHPWVINEYSEQKEAALQFLAESLTPEYQTKLSRVGTPPVLMDEAILAQFGADNKVYEGKNVLAFFEGVIAPPPEKQSVWDQYVDFGKALEEFAKKGTDVQTVLRVLKEESEIKIKDAKAQN
ncbi:ABC transporter substrate-binding protein [Bacillus sp. FSL K6-3431]|uniref:ABC transporter substrate-binding protein n=1 Tax=Bacillus sp. FSL K6-3431 TaxID=2921500 RepID=UPI0030F5E664